jgi:hypothetical protein
MKTWMIAVPAAVVFAGLLAAVYFLVGGGGGGSSGGLELLDMVHTDSYWALKGQTVTAESMIRELESSSASVPDISSLLRQLEAEETNGWSETAWQAERTLRRMGPPILPQLREARDRLPPVRSDEYPSDSVGRKARSLTNIIEYIEERPSPEQAPQVRRLMALRTIGERKFTEARSAVSKCLDSKAPFEAEYARWALDRLDGKTATYEMVFSAVSSGDRNADLNVLPADCGIVAQALAPTYTDHGLTQQLEKFVEQFTYTREGNADRQRQALMEMTGDMLDGLERLGNLRLTLVTCGASKDIGDNSGFVVVVARGKYSPELVKTFLRREVFRHDESAREEQIEGVDVMTFERGEATIMMPSDERFILIGGPRQSAKPVREVAAAIKGSGQGGLFKNDAMNRALGDVNRSAPLWGVALISAYRGVRGFPRELEAFDSAALQMDTQGDDWVIKVTGRGPDAGRIRDFTQKIESEYRRFLGQADEELNRRPDNMPPGARDILDMARAVTFTSDGGVTIITARIKGGFKTFTSTPLLRQMERAF